MMLRVWATVLLVSTFGGLMVPLFGDLHSGIDIACTDDGVLVDVGHHTTTQIETVRPPETDGHCAVCHLQRALTGAADDAKRYVSVAQGSDPSFPTIAGPTDGWIATAVPSRAPPTLSL